jgi:hypothetical protein
MRDFTKNSIKCTLNTFKKVIPYPLVVKKVYKQVIELIMPPAGLPNKGLRKKLHMK